MPARSPSRCGSRWRPHPRYWRPRAPSRRQRPRRRGRVLKCTSTGSATAASAFMTASTSPSVCLVHSRISARPSTASYSRNSAVEHSNRTLPEAACRNNALLAPKVLRKAATMTLVSTTSLTRRHHTDIFGDVNASTDGARIVSRYGVRADMDDPAVRRTSAAESDIRGAEHGCRAHWICRLESFRDTFMRWPASLRGTEHQFKKSGVR